MNGHRLTVGLMILALCAACLFQSSLAGCAGRRPSGDDGSESSGDQSAFFDRSSRNAGGTPGDWASVSQTVIKQVEDMYGARGIALSDLERSHSGPSAVRCSLAPRLDLQPMKQLLDGLFLLYSTFPNQQVYVVSIDEWDDAEVETDWNSLVALVEEGYSFDTPDEQTEYFWNMMTGAAEDVDPSSGDAIPSVSSQPAD